MPAVVERPSGSRLAAAFFIGLFTLVTVAMLYAPRFARPVAPVVVAPPLPPSMPAVEVWLSTEDRRLQLAQQPSIETTVPGEAPADVVVNVDKSYQTMVGFGAAMTDSSAWLLQNKINALQRGALLHELYGPPPNLGLNMMRLTIGASDFSLDLYTLDDLPSGQTDPDLTHFNVAPNTEYLIPTVQEVLKVNPDMRIIASSWTAPGWMKSSQVLVGGELLEEYESAYADYLVKYIDAYRGYGIPIFALTLQNEPSFSPLTYPGMLMPAATRARVIAKYLGPKLASRKSTTRILDWDHNWNHPEEPLAVLGDPDAARYVDGVAWHCYAGAPHAQGDVHRAFPQKDVYMTECSGGDWASAANGELIWFSNNLLIASIRQWARGVVYWNLALDENHGPHFGGCALCKGIVTIDSQTGEITRNDEYYAIAHFSRFVLPGAVRVGSTATEKGLENVAFQNVSDESMVLVVVNSHTEARPVTVKQGPVRFQYTMPPRSVATFVWNSDQAGAWIRRALGWLNAPPASVKH
jgi:glucosylceramidase